MIRSRLLAVPAFILFLFTVTPADEMPADEGLVAVYIEAPEFVGRGEYNGDNLLNCLKNHIDYYLWYKGWQFEFLEADAAVSREHWRDSLRDGAFEYLLYIRPKAKIKLEQTSADGGKENKSIRNYDCRLRIELEVFLDNLETGETIIGGKKAGAKAGPGWMTIDDQNEAGEPGDPVEPPDFTVKRALSAALSFLPEKERNRRISSDDMPVYFVVDKEIDEDCQSGIGCSYRVAFDYASRSLRKQYGFGLKPCGQAHLSARNLTMASINSLFRNILKSQPVRKDTLTVGIFRPNQPHEYYQPNRRLKVGLSDLGRQVLLISELSPPNQMTSEWKGFLNGQLLLHEIGHLLGAVHVSDINSIMTSRAVWVSSDLFDPLNDYIIRATRRQGRQFQNITEYLGFVISCINETGYKLSDYPGHFFSYISPNKEIMKSGLFDGEGLAKSISYAVKAYGHFILKDYETARDDFYKALVCDSTQGAVHYYLSKATSGPLSDLHLRKSAEIGYYGAIHEHINLEK